MEREHRRRFREIRRRRGQNVNQAPEVRAAWQRCRELSLAYLDAVIAAHAAGGPGAVAGFGKYGHLLPDEQAARQNLDHHDWVRQMEDTPWFPGRSGDRSQLAALEAEIFAAWGEYAFHARIQEEETNCAGFDVERARLYQAGAVAVGFDDEDELAGLTDGGLDLSGRTIEPVLPPEALRVLGRDFAFKHRAAEDRAPDAPDPGLGLPRLLADQGQPRTVPQRRRRPAGRPRGGHVGAACCAAWWQRLRMTCISYLEVITIRS